MRGSAVRSIGKMVTCSALFALAACERDPVSTAPRAARTPSTLVQAARAVAGSDTIPGAYIILLRDDVSSVGAVAREAIRVHGGRQEYVFEHVVKGFSVRALPAPAAAALARLPEVVLVEPVRVAYPDGIQPLPFNGTSYRYSDQWGLDRIDEQGSPAFNGSYTYNATGAGVHIYIVDSGVNGSHSEFAGRQGQSTGTFLINGIGYVGPWSDEIGHGTAVAGLAAGTNYGVAKNAIIHSVRIDDNINGTPCSVIVNGLDWIASHVERPAVVNMSYSGNCSTVKSAITRLINAGVTFAKSAGNGNVDASQDVSNTAAGLIVVGATDQADGRAFYSNGEASNYGSYLTLFAPGASMLTASRQSSTGTTYFSGTSAAAPLVAGVAALVLEQQPSAAPSTVRSLLVNNASNVYVANAGSSPNRVLYSLGPYAPPFAVSISGASSISTPGSYPYYASVTGTSEPYSVSWELSYSGGASWSQVGTGTSYTYDVYGGAGPFTVTLRATATTQSGAATSSTWEVYLNTACGGQFIC